MGERAGRKSSHRRHRAGDGPDRERLSDRPRPTDRAYVTTLSAVVALCSSTRPRVFGVRVTGDQVGCRRNLLKSARSSSDGSKTPLGWSGPSDDRESAGSVWSWKIAWRFR